MTMIKEAYERLNMDVTEFDVEDVITTSGIDGGGGTGVPFFDDDYEDHIPNNTFTPIGM